MEWYYAEEGQSKGPVSEADLKALAEAGTIKADTLVWRTGMPDWVAYSSILAPTTPAIATATTVCSQCGKTFPSQDVISYEGKGICATCKPAFFQKLQEGAAIGGALGPGGTGATPNRELMAQARTALSGKWGIAIGAMLVYAVIAGGAGFVPFVGGLISFLITGPMVLGLYVFYLNLARGNDLKVDQVFSGFKSFWKAFLLYLLIQLLTFAWILIYMVPALGLMFGFMATGHEALAPLAFVITLPLMIPAAMAIYSYTQAWFIFADNREIGVYEAVKTSTAMMKGVRLKLFFMSLRFIGWMLLCILTLFIGYLWLAPYYMTASVRFYEDVRGRANTARV